MKLSPFFGFIDLVALYLKFVSLTNRIISVNYITVFKLPVETILNVSCFFGLVFQLQPKNILNFFFFFSFIIELRAEKNIFDIS